MLSILTRTELAATALVIALSVVRLTAASTVRGQVTFAGVPVPGATVTATKGDVTRTTITDEEGVYRLADLADGPWTVRVTMLGFFPLEQEVVAVADALPTIVALTVMPFEEIAAAAGAGNERNQSTGASVSLAAVEQPGIETSRGAVAAKKAPSTTTAPPQTRNAPPNATGGNPVDDQSADAADGLLVNGSVNNGAASPFAQLPAFGNNRRGSRSLYSGGIGGMFGNSAWDARPFSFSGQPAPKPNYYDAEVVGSFAGPVKIPWLKNKANLFLGYQHQANHDATTHPALVPTTAERHGDFSQSVDALGRPAQIIDPATGLPFAGNIIPSSRISTQAVSLLGLYPEPNVESSGRYNLEVPVL